jgi:acyl-CoA thioesterase I
MWPKVLVFQPGGNDDRRGVPREERQANIGALLAKAKERGIRVVTVTDDMYQGLPYQADRIHLTAEGYHALASKLLPRVVSALRR